MGERQTVRQKTGKLLTIKFIEEKSKPRNWPAKPKEYPDGGGLFLTVRPNGSMSFNLRYRFDGRPRNLTLGPLLLGLSEARKAASEALGQVARGIDPGAAKSERKAATKAPAQAQDSVAGTIDRYLQDPRKAKGAQWKASWRKEAERLLRVEVASKWGRRRISDITDADIQRRLEDIGRRAPATARNVFRLLRGFFNWAVKRKLIAVSPCAGLDSPSADVSRDRVLSHAELRLIWRASEKLDYPFGPLIRLLILTGQRRGEVAGLRWPELIDGVWTIPGERTKNGRVHIVPLPRQALAIIGALPRFNRSRGKIDFAFSPNQTPPSGFSRFKGRLDAAILELLREDDPKAEPLSQWQLHDLRRTVVTNLNRLKTPWHVREAVVNHLGHRAGVAGVYDRYDYFDEKQEALARWADDVDRIVDAESSNVVASNLADVAAE